MLTQPQFKPGGLLQFEIRKNGRLLPTFRAIVPNAQQLAVRLIGFAALIPWRDMVGFHFGDIELLTALHAYPLLPLVSPPLDLLVKLA